MFIDSLSKLSWPGAFVIVGVAFAVSLAFIVAVIALSGSNFPWEK